MLQPSGHWRLFLFSRRFPMDAFISYFGSLGLDFNGMLKFTLVLLLGALLASTLIRFIFRKQTLLGSAVSSSIAIVFIYVVMVLILTLVSELHFLVTPLPFAVISKECIHFFSFSHSSYPMIASELVSMMILAFLVNLVDGWLPRGNGLLRWLFWRCLTVAIGFFLHYLVAYLFNRYLPQGIILYAPGILLAILVLLLLTGALRFLVGLILTTVNPIIAALYTFFFASIIGKQITKAVLTTGILSGLIYLLEDLGISFLSLAPGGLVAYIPFLLLLIPVWYLASRP